MHHSNCQRQVCGLSVFYTLNYVVFQISFSQDHLLPDWTVSIVAMELFRGRHKCKTELGSKQHSLILSPYSQYWMYKFREVNSSSFGFELIPEYFDTKTNTQRLFDSYLSIASNAPVLFVFIINYINCLQFLGEKRRNVMLFSVMITVFAVINSFVLINTDQSKFRIGKSKIC